MNDSYTLDAPSQFYVLPPDSSFFFFNDTATTEIYTLSLHDALPICIGVILGPGFNSPRLHTNTGNGRGRGKGEADRKSTRLNSSHSQISYAVFCLKKKRHHRRRTERPELVLGSAHLLCLLRARWPVY